MAKSKSFDESKVSRGADGRFIAQGGAVELRMVYPNPPSTLPVQRSNIPAAHVPTFGNYSNSNPAAERLMKIRQHGTEMLYRLNQPGADSLYRTEGDILNRRSQSSKPSRRRGSVA
jgi:hypothetical protein